jgi:phosphatidylglycerophosphatase A
VSARLPARVLLSHPLGWIATGFGVGLAPVAAGTFGSLAALLPWGWWLRALAWPAYLAVVVIAFALGTWASSWVVRRGGVDDPGSIVWDEFVGQWLALWPVGAFVHDWRFVVAGFALFRLFDIWKPWPVRWADRSVHGGFGVMLDDVLAGAMAFVVLQGAIAAWPHLVGGA